MHIIEAAELMGISKTLFANIVNRAVWKVAEGLIFGKILEIEGENPERDFKEPIL